MSESFTVIQLAAVMSSPAHVERSEHYPAHWKGQVPTVVGMLKTVRSELPIGMGPVLVANAEDTFPVWVNSHGAVSAVFPDGSRLGLKPLEFVVIKFYTPYGGAA